MQLFFPSVNSLGCVYETILMMQKELRADPTFLWKGTSSQASAWSPCADRKNPEDPGTISFFYMLDYLTHMWRKSSFSSLDF